MEFVDSLKRWFFNNNSSAASSDARVPLLNANGTPKGSDTMANLASVLGGILIESYGGTFANMPTGTWIQYWYSTDSAANEKGWPCRSGIAYKTSGSIDMFAIVKSKVDSGVWVKNKDVSATETSWQRIDNFGYNTLPDLASALGVTGDIAVFNGLDDANNAQYGVLYWCTGGATAHTAEEQGLLISFYNSNTKWGIQFFATKTSLYMRAIYFGSWGSWLRL